MTWQTQDTVQSPITINQTGSYAVIVKHLHRTTHQDFIVVGGSKVVTVIIPERNATGYGNFEPATIKLVNGINNTVRWINEQVVPVSIEADDEADPLFFNATSEHGSFEINDNSGNNNFLMPGQFFEFTFTKPGKFGYHSVPGPDRHGMVVVLPAPQK
jgi:plastocyanin